MSNTNNLQGTSSTTSEVLKNSIAGSILHIIWSEKTYMVYKKLS